MSDGAGGRIRHLRPLPPAPPYDTGHPVWANGAGRQGAAADITAAIVGLLRERTGRGPTRAKTTMSEGFAIVTLDDCLTQAERTLVAEGHRSLASQLRTAVHQGMRRDAVAAVEAISGREVIAYLTDEQQDPNLAVIVFVLDASAGPPA